MTDPYHSLAALAKAFADPNRLLILEHLAQGASSVEDLSGRTNLPLGNLSHHLQILKSAGLVKATRRGRQIYYQVQGPLVIKTYQGLMRLAEALETHDHWGSRQETLVLGPKIPRQEALKLIQLGKAVLLDVRPLEEYNAGHIRGAVHIPLELLNERINNLPQGKMIVSYCRGPYCQLSLRAVALLKSHGKEAHALEDGYPQWWAEGLPIEVIDEEHNNKLYSNIH